MKYALERILFRLSRSKHRDLFILKGALLFELWTQQTYRPTRDLDFLASGKSDVKRLVTIVRDVCSQETFDDGLAFDLKSVLGERIKEDADYEGVRIQFVSFLGNARIPIQIDMAFGDVVTPDPLEIEYPTLLDRPPPRCWPIQKNP
jgi:predicted nucleotidyltransferase component of viral defense system